jgi:hypothetical protein
MTQAPPHFSRGLRWILLATAIAGALGYLIQLLAPALLPDAQAYVTFSVFWSALHLAVAGISGVQQEVTRATHPSAVATGGRSLRRYALVAAVGLVLLSVVFSVVLAPRVFPLDSGWLAWWFAVGVLGNLLLALLAGVLYGLTLWSAIAALTIVDASLRAGLVVVGLVWGAPESLLAAFIAVPFGAAAVIVWLAIRRRVNGRFGLDVDLRGLLVHTISTVTAATATGVMVTGLPLILRLTVPDIGSVALASLILVITVTRAPLIIPLIALQSYLIVRFGHAAADVWRLLTRYLLGAAAVTVLAAVAAALVGPALIRFVSGGEYDVSAFVAAAVLVSAGIVAMMCLTGPALLSRSRHNRYVAGWAVAAVATVSALLLPVPAEPRILIALIAAPMAGLAVHAISIRGVGGRGAQARRHDSPDASESGDMNGGCNDR